MDLTWERDLVYLGYPARWLLKSDKAFMDHSPFVPLEKTKLEKCDTSVIVEDLKTIKGFKMAHGIYKKSDKARTWLKNSLKEINLSDINKALKKLERHVLNDKEREEEK